MSKTRSWAADCPKCNRGLALVSKNRQDWECVRMEIGLDGVKIEVVE